MSEVIRYVHQGTGECFDVKPDGTILTPLNVTSNRSKEDFQSEHGWDSIERIIAGETQETGAE